MCELSGNLKARDKGDSDSEDGYLELVMKPTAIRAGSADSGPNPNPATVPPGGAKTPPPTTTTMAMPLRPYLQPHRHSSPAQLPLHAPHSSRSLSALRKTYESELLSKEREKTMRILRAQAGYFQQSEDYVSGLLQRRQQLRQRLNEKISDMFQGFLNLDLRGPSAVATEKRRVAVRSALLDLAQQEDDFVVITPLVESFASKYDPIALQLRHLLKCTRNLLSLAERETNPAETVERTLDDISLVEYHLVEILARQFHDLDEPGLPLSVKVSLQQYLFSTSLEAGLMVQLRRLCHDEDQRIRRAFLGHSWEDLFVKLKVRGKFQLPREGVPDGFPISNLGPYQRAIEQVRQLSCIPTPHGKILALTRACNLLCQAYEEEGVEETLGSEDLLMLMAYVLVRAQIPDLASQLLFISRLVPEELIKGEPGYVLATVQTSLEYALAQFE